MLNKEQTSRITRIIALVAAISFVLSFIPILYTGFSGQKATKKQPPANSATTNTTATNSTTQTTATAPKNNAVKIKNLIDQAGLNVEIKNYELAVTYYKQALDTDPNNLDAKSGLGIAQVLKGDNEGGYNQLKSVVANNPEQADSQFYLGIAATKLGKADEAKAAYEAYLKLEPSGQHADTAKKALNQ